MLPRGRPDVTGPGGTATVSVVIPVYNRAVFLASCLESVGRQDTDAPVEVIVVDDASDDTSASVAADMGATVISLPVNGGPSVARNAGIERAKGQWIAFLDSDDRWAPEHLRVLLDAAGDHVLVSSSGLSLAGGRKRSLGTPSVRRVEVRGPAGLLRPENAVYTSAAMVRADAVRRVGGFGALRWSEDLELWLALLRLGPALLLPDITVYGRSHDGQTSRLHGTEMGRTAQEVLAAARQAGDLRDRELRAFATVMWWDELRRNDGSNAVRTALRQPDHFADLCRLFGARASQRHRWRLRPRQVATVSALAGPGG
jgi:glycosyltransferase involved in cell wall biosynthesis